MLVKITGNIDFNADRFGVKFNDGVAIGEFDEDEIYLLRAWGLKVEEIIEEEAPKSPAKKSKKNEK